MSEVKCPHCKAEQEINHDDGYGYEEDREYDQECVCCEKTFRYTTVMSLDYEVFCTDDHELLESGFTSSGGGRNYRHYYCGRCDYKKRVEVG